LRSSSLRRTRHAGVDRADCTVLADVPGTIEPTEVGDAITHSPHDAIVACGLAAGVTGEMLLRIIIDPDGRVLKAAIEPRDVESMRCLTAAFARTRFRASEQGADVTIRFAMPAAP
jgi:hypothetical protein